MTRKEFIEKVNAEWSNVFPESRITAKAWDGLGGKSIVIKCYLAGNDNEVPYGIWVNDMFKVMFNIDLPDDYGDDKDMPENLVMTVMEKSIAIKPVSRYLYYDRYAMPWRKVKGSPEKLIGRLAFNFAALMDTMKNLYGLGKIHPEFVQLVGKKMTLNEGRVFA